MKLYILRKSFTNWLKYNYLNKYTYAGVQGTNFLSLICFISYFILKIRTLSLIILKISVLVTLTNFDTSRATIFLVRRTLLVCESILILIKSPISTLTSSYGHKLSKLSIGDFGFHLTITYKTLHKSSKSQDSGKLFYVRCTSTAVKRVICLFTMLYVFFQEKGSEPGSKER